MNKKSILFFLIILLALFFRLWQLPNVPPSASLDEASIGWNAYSILQTGRDEYGYKLPILLRAYDDYRPALYVYFVIPFIKLLDLNVLAVRIPSILLSIITIVSSYYLVKSLFKNHKHKDTLALFVVFLLAISPWNIYISRLGHEVNAGLAFAVLGILFFIQSCEDLKKKRRIVLSALFFALSFYTYQSEKAFVPLIILALSLIYIRKLWNIKKIVIIAAIIGIVLSAPIIVSSFSKEGLTRLSGTTAFNLDDPMYVESANNLLDAKRKGDLVGEVISNRRVTSVKVFIAGYISHFNPMWIFGNITRGDSFKAPDMGLLHIWEAPFLLIGIILLFSKKYSRRQKAIILSWIGTSLVAPAISSQAPHAMRSYNILPVPQILVGIGFVSVLSFFDTSIKKPKLKSVFIVALAIIIFFNSIYFVRQYFVFFPVQQSASFQYGLSKSIQFVLEKEDVYKKIVFSNREDLLQSYMFYLFYSKYDPNLYLEQGGTRSGGFNQIHKFGKYEFRSIDWSNDNSPETTLYVGGLESFPEKVKAIGTFYNLNGEKVIKAVEKK